MAQHGGNVAIIARFRPIQYRFQLGRQEIVERRDQQRAVRGLHGIAHAPESDAAEERKLHRAGRRSERDHERVGLVLKDRRR